ncbi:hypothetical protein BDF22DRAFT_653646 [Syncephalis plumigaleata]|nr:hypothetical protein BDF22DRAFT_653646 [Syncephalis plumigaleata]
MTTGSRKAFNYSSNDTEPKTVIISQGYFRFCLPRSLTSVEEVEQVVDYFRSYGRVVTYRLSRCPDTYRPYNTGFIGFAKDANIKGLLEKPVHKIEKLGLDVELASPTASVVYQSRLRYNNNNSNNSSNNNNNGRTRRYTKEHAS